ncbi:MAG: hypothetical protein ACK6BZ_12370, partial [Candidatus Kapaibacterium sp.]
MWNNANGVPHTIDEYYHINARLGDIETDVSKSPQSLCVRDTNYHLTLRSIFNLNADGAHSGARSHNNPLYGIALHYDVCAPNRTRSIPGTNASYQETYPDWTDPSGGAFGFLSRNSGYDSVFADGNKQRVYRANTISPGTIILSHPYPNDELMRDETNVSPSLTTEDQRNVYGYDMYLTLNVRLLDVQTSLPDDTVLIVRLPYTTKPGKGALLNPTRYSVFDSIPSLMGAIVPITANFKPIYRGSHAVMAASTANAFIITRRMLRDTASITFSAHCQLRGDDGDGVLAGSENHALWHIDYRANYDTIIGGQVYNRHKTSTGASARITRMEPEIIYKGNCDIAIDWVRLETKAAKQLFSGQKDNQIRQSVQTAIDRCSTFWGSYPGRLRWHRIWVTEEDLPRTFHANGYANRLFKGRATTETGYTTAHIFREFDENGIGIESVDPPYTRYRAGQIQYYTEHSARETGIKENWRGDTYSLFPSVPAPFIWNSTYAPSAHNFGLYNGYFKRFAANPKDDLYNFGTLPSATITGSNEYRLSWRWPNSSLMMAENAAHRYAADPYFLFDTKHRWYTSVWVSPLLVIKDFSNFGICTSGVNCPRNTQFEYLRTNTGEELRFTHWLSRILGSQGDVIWVNRSKSIVSNWDDVLITNPPVPNNTNGDLYRSYIGYHTIPTYNNAAPAPTNKQWLRNESLGSDYLQTNDPTFIDVFSPNPNIVADTLGIQPGKFFLGRKTMRYETKQHHDWVRTVDDTLLRLDLDYWYGKGFRTFNTSRNGAKHNFFNRKIDTTKIFTRHIYFDTTLWNYSVSLPEPIDSSFCDITMLRDRTKNDTNEFYVGVLNRRLDPIFTIPINDSLTLGTHYTNTAISTTKRYCFLPTPEFDSLLTLGTHPLIANKTMHRYCQFGAREITIPFKVCGQTIGDYTLLRIRELGGSLDTIISCDKPLAMKYLPGEGKIFHVQKVPYSNSIRKGHLAHSNQRKIVGYPIYRRDSTGQWTETDSMYYHAVYHRWDINFSGAPDQSVVVYSRSKPMPRGLDSNRVIWDSTLSPGVQQIHEIAVTQEDVIRRDNGSSIERRYCAYPAVVVRRDSLGEPFVYIVYTCHNNGEEDPALAWVCESTLPAQGIESDQLLRLYNAALIETYTDGSGGVQEQLRQWGTPMINASANGNFYCWSDSLQGIGYGWKHPNARYFNLLTPQINYAAWGTTFNQSVPGTYPYSRCKHPSLNSYSRIALNEDNCSLVWQEQDNTYSGLTQPRIIYTRLRLNQWGIPTLYLPQQNRWSYQPGATTLSFHPIYPIAALSSNGCAAHRFPSVYREVHDGIMSGNRNADTMRTMLWEHIYFEFDQSNCSYLYRYPNTVHSIVHANIDLYDRPDAFGRMQPDSAHATVWSHIWGKPNVTLLQPNASQGAVEYKTSSTPVPLARPVWLLNQRRMEHINVSDYALNLNFIQTDISGIPSANALIWQMPHNRFTLRGLGINDITFTGQTWSQTMTDNGQYPHLAARPTLRTPADWQRGRRIFEADDSIPPTIMASVERLAKRRSVNEAVALIGYGSENCQLLISPLDIGDNRLHWTLFEGKNRQHDTLATPWFRVGKDLHLAMDVLGGQMEGQTLIEHKDTKRQYLFPFTMTRRGNSEKRLYSLIDGNDDQYRILIINGNSANQSLQSHLLIRPEEEPFQKENLERTVISLDANDYEKLSLRLYPNPANDELSVVWSGGKATVEILDSQGLTVFSVPMTTSVTLSTKELS